MRSGRSVRTFVSPWSAWKGAASVPVSIQTSIAVRAKERGAERGFAGARVSRLRSIIGERLRTVNRQQPTVGGNYASGGGIGRAGMAAQILLGGVLTFSFLPYYGAEFGNAPVFGVPKRESKVEVAQNKPFLFGTVIAARRSVREGRFHRGSRPYGRPENGARSSTPLRCATRRAGFREGGAIWRPVTGRCQGQGHLPGREDGPPAFSVYISTCNGVVSVCSAKKWPKIVLVRLSGFVGWYVAALLVSSCGEEFMSGARSWKFIAMS
jgi:hypothetical protein